MDDKSNKKKIKNVNDISSQEIQSASIVLGVAGDIAPVLVPFTIFLPLIKEIGAIFDEIIDIVEAAEHNKRTCKLLKERVRVAESAVRQLREEKDDKEGFFNNKNYSSLQELAGIIKQIKKFVSEISQMKTLTKYIRAKDIEKTFTDLCKEFDSSFNLLSVSIDAKSLEQLKSIDDNILKRSKSIEDELKELRADQDEFAKFLRELVPFTKFVPLIKEIGAIFDEIIDIVEVAEHNKRTCKSLLERVRVADSAVRQLREKKVDKDFFNNENFLYLQDLTDIIRRIKNFISEVSQMKTVIEYIRARNIEKTFADLCKEFDSSFKLLPVSIDLKRTKSIEDKLEELKADQDEFAKLLREMVKDEDNVNASIISQEIQSSSTAVGIVGEIVVADKAPVLVPFTEFVPLIKEIGAIFDEIIDIEG